MKTKSKVAAEIKRRHEAGLCTALSCKRKPRKKPDGTLYAYCEFHRKANKVRAEKWAAKHGKTAKKAASRRRKAAKPKPVAQPQPEMAGTAGA